MHRPHRPARKPAAATPYVLIVLLCLAMALWQVLAPDAAAWPAAQLVADG